MPSRRDFLTSTLFAASGLLAAGGLAGCATSGAEPNIPADPGAIPGDPASLSPASTFQAVSAIGSLTARLYRQLAQTPGNLVCSPYSALMALAMTRVGARGITAREMDGVLDVPQETSLAPALRAVSHALSTLPKGLTLDVANSLWGQASEPWRPRFLQILTAEFDAPLNTVDFVKDAEGARRSINAWTKDKTHGKIPELIAPGVLDELSRLVLVNAVYLKAPWAEPFDPNLTQPGTFTHLEASTSTVKFMHRDPGSLPYAKGAGWQAVDLPYAGGHLAMSVILPDTAGMAALEKALTEAWLGRLFTSFAETPVVFAMPRWTFTTAVELGSALRTLGMPTAFSAQADFGGMTSGSPLSIGAVVHQGFIAVGEKGTEAAAATAVEMRATGALQDPGVAVILDRPFLFVIRHVDTGVPIFIGRVEAPTPA